MPAWSTLRAVIADAIKPNGNQEITAEILQKTLLNIVNLVGKNKTFAGIVGPNTDLGSSDGPIFCVALEPGIYSNFGEFTIEKGEIALLQWDGEVWSKDTIFAKINNDVTEPYVIKSFSAWDLAGIGFEEMLPWNPAETEFVRAAVANNRPIAISYADEISTGALWCFEQSTDSDFIYLNLAFEERLIYIEISSDECFARPRPIGIVSHTIMSIRAEEIIEGLRRDPRSLSCYVGYDASLDGPWLRAALDYEWPISIWSNSRAKYLCTVNSRSTANDVALTFTGPDNNLYRIDITNYDMGGTQRPTAVATLLSDANSAYILEDLYVDKFNDDVTATLSARDYEKIVRGLTRNVPLYVPLWNPEDRSPEQQSLCPISVQLDDAEIYMTIVSPRGIYHASSLDVDSSGTDLNLAKSVQINDAGAANILPFRVEQAIDIDAEYPIVVPVDIWRNLIASHNGLKPITATWKNKINDVGVLRSVSTAADMQGSIDVTFILPRISSASKFSVDYFVISAQPNAGSYVINKITSEIPRN